MFTIEFVSYFVSFHLGNLDFSWLMRLKLKICDMGFCFSYMSGLNSPLITTTIEIRICMCRTPVDCVSLSCVLFTMTFANLRLSIFYSPQLYANWLNKLK